MFASNFLAGDAAPAVTETVVTNALPTVSLTDFKRLFVAYQEIPRHFENNLPNNV